MICPPLEGFSSFIQILCTIVSRSYLIFFNMCSLEALKTDVFEEPRGSSVFQHVQLGSLKHPGPYEPFGSESFNNQWMFNGFGAREASWGQRCKLSPSLRHGQLRRRLRLLLHRRNRTPHRVHHRRMTHHSHLRRLNHRDLRRSQRDQLG